MKSLPDPIGGQLWLVLAPHAAAEQMIELAARLAIGTSLRVVDGGNRFNAYLGSRAIARRLWATGEGDLEAALRRIRVARAFTCYQMLTLLGELPEVAAPTLVLDLLATFHDESIAAEESLRILHECCKHLRRLSAQAPLVASAVPLYYPPEQPRSALLEILVQVAQRVWNLEPVSLPDPQLALF